MSERRQTNLPLPDQLRAVREEIKALKKEEADLIAEVQLAGKIEGAYWAAYVDHHDRKSFDRKGAEKALGAALDPFFELKKVAAVKLKPLD